MVAYTTEKFRNENPKVYAAYVAALKEVMDTIAKDPKGTTKDYLDASRDPITLEEGVEIVTDPGSKFTVTPQNVATFANFMAKQGLTKVKPDSWKDMFFPEVHGLPGS
jgi:NitT/TauT family transport system substrate-binding protein